MTTILFGVTTIFLRSFLVKKKLLIIFLGGIWILNAIASSKAVINTPVADMYKQPSENAAVISSAIYNTKVEVINSAKGNNWFLIKTSDNYRGWVMGRDLVGLSNYSSKDIAKVKNLFANIYAERDTTRRKALVIAPFGTKLSVKKFFDKRWIQVRLANGNLGWIQSGDVTLDLKPLTMRQMLKLSRKFIGLPFTWGGKSSYGFDCSGFVQMLYKQMGILLPRDTGVQADWYGFVPVAKKNLQPGDVLYFGWNNKIGHTAVYLGNNLFINSTPYNTPTVHISDLRDKHWRSIYITARRLKSRSRTTTRFVSNITPLPASVKQQMQKYTWHKGCPVGLNDLDYVKLSYWGFDNKPHQGVLIVNKYLAPEIVAIFKDLYQHGFPIQKMRPMYLYKGNDNASMLANNTVAFGCRKQVDFPDLFSIHSYGGAIDINPLLNPYVNGNKVLPPESRKYLSKNIKGRITSNGIVVKDFAKYGWVWGGSDSWSQYDIHDYQHFEKPFNKQNG
jgi:cell wall-associated NlpC family hydrolase